MVLVLDTIAPATLAATFTGPWTVEATIKSTAQFPVETLRDLYRFAVAQGNDKAAFVVTKAAALQAERAAAHEEALATTPATRPCDGCPGDGVYRFPGGCFENGVWKGSVGPCFRCQGKGTQTPEDVKRCEYYDNRVRRVYA